jgi:carboxypeptidase Q
MRRDAVTRRVVVVVLALLSTPMLRAAEPIDEGTIARIKVEGFQHSAVMDTLSWLSDVYGPRLSGSSGLRHAAEWARDRMTSWGLTHAALEPYDLTYRGWTLTRFDIAMTAPQYMRIYGYPKAWSPSLQSPLTGTPVLVEVHGREDFEKYHGKLRGAIVMNGRPAVQGPGFDPEATRLSDDDLAQMAAAQTPTRRGDEDTPASLADEERDWNQELDKEVAVEQYFAEEGVAAVILPSPIPEDVRVQGYYDTRWHPTYPTFVISREHYGRLVRMLDRKVPVALALSLTTEITPGVQGFNVVAELAGQDARLSSQVVMLGAHLDSWHSGTGATDNGAGCAVVMEAMRILQTLGVKPRRTIRVALWTGEEQDYFGSVGYVRRHFGDPETHTVKPEHASLAAYFNLDNGSGRIRGVNLQGNEAARPIFEAWLAPFHYLGATTITTLNTGGTDHMVFNAVGLPGFQFIQDPLNYETRVHHSSLDVYEEASPDDLEQAAVIIASVAYHAAMRDDMLPRPPGPPSTGSDAVGPN